jgi:RNA polymerase sigma-70 factor (ECF subfamily)
LRAGDDAVFAEVVDQHTPSMLRAARGYVSSHEIAEEVAQETWIALVKGIGKFEGRSSLRTWLFTVMINMAKSRGVGERRDSDAAIAAFARGKVDPARFPEPGDPYRPLEARSGTVAFPRNPRGVGAGQ